DDGTPPAPRPGRRDDAPLALGVDGEISGAELDGLDVDDVIAAVGEVERDDAPDGDDDLGDGGDGVMNPFRIPAPTVDDNAGDDLDGDGDAVQLGAALDDPELDDWVAGAGPPVEPELGLVPDLGLDWVDDLDDDDLDAVTAWLAEQAG
ncbi:MAG: hypothetical protein H6708_34730, partial [Kofleriaceae bacterium]|nr:hypothetical protein [Kofleriaceae bacterium]